MNTTTLRARILSAQGPFSLTFTKADGTTRRMIAEYRGHSSATPDTITVIDLEEPNPRKHYKCVRLDRVHAFGPIRLKTEPRNYAEAKAELDYLFS